MMNVYQIKCTIVRFCKFHSEVDYGKRSQRDPFRVDSIKWHLLSQTNQPTIHFHKKNSNVKIQNKKNPKCIGILPLQFATF